MIVVNQDETIICKVNEIKLEGNKIMAYVDNGPGCSFVAAEYGSEQKAKEAFIEAINRVAFVEVLEFKWL